MALAVVTPARAAARVATRTLAVDRIDVAWTVSSERIEVELSAPCEGWVAFGLNAPGRGLDGARLFFVAVLPDGSVRAEEHVARPPTHRRVERAGEPPALSVIEASQGGGRTRARLAVRLGAAPGTDVVVRAGERYELVLAYSVSDNLDHHSRHRVHRVVEL